MISLYRCRSEEMERQGLGGEILVFKKAGIKYVVKINEQAQSINEYVAQHLLKALGFDDVPVELVEYSGTVYGATIFQEGITRMYPANTASVPDAMKQTVLELYILNSILNNADEGEFYSQRDNVISLDYGEALIPIFWLNIAIHGGAEFADFDLDVCNSINSALNILSKYYGADLCENAACGLVEKFEKLDLDDLEECFISLNEALYEGFSMVYYKYIAMLKDIMMSLDIG